MENSSITTGLRHAFSYEVPPNRTVPHLYPEAPEFVPMPEVFATGFLVGLLEWTCVQLLKPHLDWPAEQSVGTHISISHEAATPPGLVVTAEVELTEVDGRRLRFEVRAHDGVDTIARGTHERFLIDTERFVQRAAAKAQ
ncbi:thioesterase family protein [Actinomadura sp. 6N118]|uniref:thioesterase family protein n=1 Tax=Actinomadura sp. 6N118 TaxID=3375151 RepID=UPI003799B8AF